MQQLTFPTTKFVLSSPTPQLAPFSGSSASLAYRFIEHTKIMCFDAVPDGQVLIVSRHFDFEIVPHIYGRPEVRGRNRRVSIAGDTFVAQIVPPSLLCLQ